ncbi:MAG: hypothetical protein WBM02_12420 [bacterium]
MSNDKKSLVPRSMESSAVTNINDQVEKKLALIKKKVAARYSPKRIIFAYDATGSREPSWELAKSIQSRMLSESLQYGNVEMMVLVYRDRFTDSTYLEHSEWSKDGDYLQSFMEPILCYGGGGNHGESIDEALDFALKQDPPVNAIILIGDEPVVPRQRSVAYQLAKDLGEKNIPVFIFQEGDRPQAEIDYKIIAENSGGVYDKFSPDSRIDFTDRLRVATIFATGGKQAIEEFIKKHADPSRMISEGAQQLARKLLGE